MFICFVGDSYVTGTGDPELLGWVGRLCRRTVELNHDVTAYNLGVRGDTSAGVAARWESEARTRRPPDERFGLVFAFGANDTHLEDGQPWVALDRSRANLRQVLQDAVRLGPTLMIGPPPLGDADQRKRVADYCAAYATDCSTLGVSYLPMSAALGESGVWTAEAQASDGYHPGPGGYAAFADLVATWTAWQSWFKGAEQ